MFLLLRAVLRDRPDNLDCDVAGLEVAAPGHSATPISALAEPGRRGGLGSRGSLGHTLIETTPPLLLHV